MLQLLVYIAIASLIIGLVARYRVRRDRRIADSRGYIPQPFVVTDRDSDSCEVCGRRLLPGETAYQTHSFLHTFCGPQCAEKAPGDERA